jgi:Lon protease-like protein
MGCRGVSTPAWGRPVSSTVELPIFPLGTVLFPQGLLPLRIFEQRYLDMIKVCIRDESAFGVCLIREGGEVGTPAVPHLVGCTASITQWDMPHLGLFQILSQGRSVFRIVEQRLGANGLLHAGVELLPEPARIPVPAHLQTLAGLLRTVIDKVGAERFPAPLALDDAAWVAHRLAECLPLEPVARQELLEQQQPLAALERIKLFLQSNSVAL